MINLLRIAAFVFLIWIVYRLMKEALLKFVARLTFTRPGGAPQIAEMVKDPVCGSYVSMDHAVTGDFSGEKLYFCSDKCLGAFMEKQSGG
jgi:YHS domain-containing protein